MAGEEAALGLLGGILNLPYSIPQQQAQAQQQAQIRDALTKSGGQFTPEVTQALMQAMLAPPAQPLGHNIPVLGSVLKGIGTTGRVIETLAGAGSPAPRPVDFINSLAGISKIQSSQRLQKVGEQLKDPTARELWAAGKTKEAWAIEHPTIKGGEFPQFQQEHPHATIEDFWNAKRAARGSGEDADPKSEFALWQKQNPGKTAADFETMKATAGAPGIEKDLEEQARAQFPNDRQAQLRWKGEERSRLTGARIEATVGAKREFGSLSPKVQEEVTGTRETIRLMDEVLAAVQTPDGQAKIGPILGRFNAGKYGVGMETDPLTVKINTLAQRISLLGGASIMRAAGTRAYQALSQMQQHFSQPYDNPTEFLTKLRENRDSILNYAKEGVKVSQQTPDEVLGGLNALDAGGYEGQPKMTAPGADPDGFSIEWHQ